MQPLLSWKAHEYEYRPKTSDWYWAMWIIVVALAVISVLFNDILLAILIMVSAFTLTLLAKRPPQIVEYKLAATGIQIRHTFYPYENLESFAIDEIPGYPPKLLIKSKKTFMPIMSMPIVTVEGGTVDKEEIVRILTPHLREEELAEPLGQKLMEYLGF